MVAPPRTWLNAAAQVPPRVAAAANAGRDPRIAPALAAVTLGCAAACYAASFALRGRNLHTYAAFGFLLLVAGTRLVLPVGMAAAVWSVLALAGMAAQAPAWRWHGCLYLLSALIASRAWAQATDLVLGGDDRSSGLALGLAGVALACCALALRGQPPGRLLAAILAGAAFWLAGGIAAAALVHSYHRLFGALAPHAYCATLRTAVLAVGAVLLAWAGARWKRLELTPLVYLVMLLGAYRLLLVDLRQEGKAALVLSLLAYGAALMLLPRWMQPRPSAAG